MKDISISTLYSGGHKGTEVEFGKLAEAWHMIIEEMWSIVGQN